MTNHRQKFEGNVGGDSYIASEGVRRRASEVEVRECVESEQINEIPFPFNLPFRSSCPNCEGHTRITCQISNPNDLLIGERCVCVNDQNGWLSQLLRQLS